MLEKDLWYKRAVIYALDVETFQDSDGDGIGDFQGLIGRLDYLATLGITCIWLLPFYPTPNRDNGYDVMDYYNVHSKLGSLGDFAAFIREAKERGIRVLIDLVVNHTSDQHPWFQKSRREENSKYRDYYTWRKEKPEEQVGSPAFAGEQEGIWAYDEVADAYYLHRFYKHQPDLNFNNPEVRRELHHIMGFWLTLGVSGFRIDAAHILVQSDKVQNKGEYYSLIEDMRDFITMHSQDAVLLAEASGPPEVVGKFFQGKDRVHMMFNFLLNQHLFLALARQEGTPLAKGLRMLPPKAEQLQWLNFLRHHDELNLEDLEEKETKEVFQAFAPDEDMRIFGRGIRRRLAPILNGDRARIELAYSLLFSLPGTPLIQYGAEIGMGDNLSLEGRTSVRTPMQWSAEKNGGFSTASADKLPHPVISEGEYAYQHLNVVRQQRETNSLLNWMERLIRLCRQYPELSNGQCDILETDPKVFAHRCTLVYTTVLVHNLSGEEVSLHLPVLDSGGRYQTEVFSNAAYDPPKGGRLTISPYGYRWFRLHPEDKERQAEECGKTKPS
ncbi:maltose alpha-D-glucosyltransferase/alpha-amylase [Pontibacter ummariensis]|uniref:Maltose alpha-D-glucosyltransferase/ alpha-amylase n=1 Tax=Pontibacter ummariensis TaxID=1610492 RepID=A0A239CR91_9BACT|nr:alpha-amylase family protein [Pontibacter ummariensis]PRY14872.1 maltose alpha-D-glucosyltransferase/alpha-amylase [Pontibacter ummariensis]SNS22617.1 maltose alpha-D-glucosyltransferase/ alpha-amylase [Pontibacter ummariensis]